MIQNRGNKTCTPLNSLTNVTINNWKEFKYFTFKYDLAKAGRY